MLAVAASTPETPRIPQSSGRGISFSSGPHVAADNAADRLAKALRDATEYMKKQVDLPGKIQIGQKSQQSLAQLLESAKETRSDKRDGLDVTVSAFKLAAHTTIKATSADELFRALTPQPYESRPSIVCVSGLSPAAISLLGSELNIDPYFFAMHLNKGAISVSSALSRNQVQTHHRYMKFEYKRLNMNGSVQEEVISVYVADIKSGRSIGEISLHI